MKCVVNIFEDSKLNFKGWKQGKSYGWSSAEVAEACLNALVFAIGE